MPRYFIRTCVALALYWAHVLLAAAAPPTNPVPATGSDPVASAIDAIARRHGDAPILILGELHGTHEAPAVLAGLVRTLAARGAVQVGLEIPAAEQPALDAWLTSDGAAVARRALLA